jgi:hypothetical protein
VARQFVYDIQTALPQRPQFIQQQVIPPQNIQFNPMKHKPHTMVHGTAECFCHIVGLEAVMLVPALVVEHSLYHVVELVAVMLVPVLLCHVVGLVVLMLSLVIVDRSKPMPINVYNQLPNMPIFRVSKVLPSQQPVTHIQTALPQRPQFIQQQVIPPQNIQRNWWLSTVSIMLLNLRR